MQQFDIILLTASKYLGNGSGNPLVENIHQEDRILIDAFETMGLACDRKAWDDPIFDWSATQYILIRTPWDYFDRYQEFVDWLERTSKMTQFINSKALIEWNIDKHYLLDLKKAGIHIPKTWFVEPKTKTTLWQSIQTAKNENGFKGEEFVLKPCIAGGAWHTYKFHESDHTIYENQFQDLIAGETMMLQEFQKSIVKKGEVSMMVIAGIFTHAVLKIAKPGDFRVQDDYGGSVHAYVPTKEEINFAVAVVHACPEPPVYARVDIFRDNEGALALAELEIFEPELWFRHHREAAVLMAEKIKEVHF